MDRGPTGECRPFEGSWPRVTTSWKWTFIRFSINPSYLILHYMFLQNNPTTRCIALVPDAFYSHCIALQGGGGSWLNFWPHWCSDFCKAHSWSAFLSIPLSWDWRLGSLQHHHKEHWFLFDLTNQSWVTKLHDQAGSGLTTKFGQTQPCLTISLADAPTFCRHSQCCQACL